MQVFRGLPVSPGIAIGRVLVVDDDLRRVVKRTIKAGQAKAEVARFDKAVEQSLEELAEVHAKARKEMGAETAKIFLFHAGMLRDKTLLTPIRATIESEQVSAEYAVSQAFASLAQKFRENSDSVFATKVNDVEDLAHRLMKHLEGETASRLSQADKDTIIIARDLTPSQTASFDRSKVRGFATDLGGKTSHTAIVARALEIPAVVGCQSLLRYAVDGMSVILDGEAGSVLLNPDETTLEQYRRLIEQRRVFKMALSEVASLPSVTADGTKIALLGNIEFPGEVRSVLAAGGEGVGLYRTEYLYLTGTREPSEEDHYRAYKKCVELSAGRELTIRTVDLGADKYTQSREEIPERNPFLGCRSIRYCLRDVPMFKRQLRALLRASALGPIKIMFPLVTAMQELRHAKYLVNDVMEELDEEGIAFDRNLKIGMMVEVPSAALMADAFAREVDFFSIGTNDLVQYTLAVDRTNERVANLYAPTHPAVIRLIHEVAKAAARRDLPVSCCGESAADLEYAILLLGLGLRTLSVTSSAMPQVKRLIRSVDIKDCERIAKQALSLDSDVRVSALLRDRARGIVPEAFEGGRAAD
jgi:phosphotransferase system enzyme I (PtsI)